MDRRRFLQSSTGLTASGMAAVTVLPATLPIPNLSRPGPRFVATWPFGIKSCEAAFKIATTDGSMLDAIEQGIWVTESDVKNASVGIGGIPTAAGQVELDACIMAGPEHSAGSVAAVQDILHPISVARLVMEKTPHVMLVGAGAREFAIQHGIQPTQLLTDAQAAAWEKWKRKQAGSSPNPPTIDEDHHDTIAMLGIDRNGDLYGGCSTSGWGYKLPGRVGDSPIIGSGLFVDNKVGAAGATGLGENVMRHCGSFLVVEMMRGGASPMEACELAVRRIAELDPKNLANLDINFVAINKLGEYGAAGTSKGFKYAVTDAEGSQVLEAKSLSEKAIGPEGGNRR